MDIIRIAGIHTDDWHQLRDDLSARGWRIERGGGLDHAWAALSKGPLSLSMEYDRYDEGEIAFAAGLRREILAELPDAFCRIYAADLLAD